MARSLWIVAAILVFATATQGQDVVAEPSQPVVINGPVYLQGQLRTDAGAPVAMVPQSHLTTWCGSAELLLMRANRRGLGYAIVDPDGDADVEGAVLALDQEMEFDAGLRVSVGVAFKGDDRLDFSYMHFSQGISADVPEPAGGRIWIPIMPPDQAENYTRVNADYDLEVNIGDIMYHRGCKSFLGRSHVSAGIRIADVDQRFNVLGSIGAGGNNPEDRFDTRAKFSGAGARVGFGFQRAIVGNLSLSANAFGSLILGEFETSAYLAENTNVEIDVFEVFRQSVPIAELEIGGVWQPGFAPRCQVFIGWQQMTFFNLSPMQYFVDDGGNDQAALVDLSHDLDLSAVAFRLAYAW
jgi:hypothetical protein